MLNYTSALTKQIVKDTEESEKDVTRMEMINRIMNLILFLLTLSFNVLYFLWETLWTNSIIVKYNSADSLSYFHAQYDPKFMLDKLKIGE